MTTDKLNSTIIDLKEELSAAQRQNAALKSQFDKEKLSLRLACEKAESENIKFKKDIARLTQEVENLKDLVSESNVLKAKCASLELELKVMKRNQ